MVLLLNLTVLQRFYLKDEHLTGSSWLVLTGFWLVLLHLKRPFPGKSVLCSSFDVKARTKVKLQFGTWVVLPWRICWIWDFTAIFCFDRLLELETSLASDLILCLNLSSSMALALETGSCHHVQQHKTPGLALRVFTQTCSMYFHKFKHVLLQWQSMLDWLNSQKRKWMVCSKPKPFLAEESLKERAWAAGKVDPAV